MRELTDEEVFGSAVNTKAPELTDADVFGSLSNKGELSDAEVFGNASDYFADEEQIPPTGDKHESRGVLDSLKSIGKGLGKGAGAAAESLGAAVEASGRSTLHEQPLTEDDVRAARRKVAEREVLQRKMLPEIPFDNLNATEAEIEEQMARGSPAQWFAERMVRNRMAEQQDYLRLTGQVNDPLARAAARYIQIPAGKAIQEAGESARTSELYADPYHDQVPIAQRLKERPVETLLVEGGKQSPNFVVSLAGGAFGSRLGVSPYATAGGTSFVLEKGDIFQEGKEFLVQKHNGEDNIPDSEWNKLNQIANQHGVFNAALDALTPGSQVARAMVGKALVQRLLSKEGVKYVGKEWAKDIIKELPTELAQEESTMQAMERAGKVLTPEEKMERRLAVMAGVVLPTTAGSVISSASAVKNTAAQEKVKPDADKTTGKVSTGVYDPFAELADELAAKEQKPTPAPTAAPSYTPPATEQRIESVLGGHTSGAEVLPVIAENVPPGTEALGRGASGAEELTPTEDEQYASNLGKTLTRQYETPPQELNPPKQPVQEKKPLALPAPRVVVSPEGEAGTESQLEQDQATRTARERELGITPDIRRVIDKTHTMPDGTVMPGATHAEAIDQAAHEAATSPKNNVPEPTEAQKEAGNYKKGHVTINGLDISIENPAGSKRRPEWSPLANHYGYIKNTVGKDKDHLDVFLGPKAEDSKAPVFVVDQIDPKTGKFDEHKIMLGFENEQAAREGYAANYAKDWQGLGAIKQLTLPEFKLWLKAGNTKKPLAYKPVLKKATTVAKQAQPTEYRVIVQEDALGEKSATIKQRNLTTDLWDNAATVDPSDVGPWLKSRDIDTASVPTEYERWDAKSKKFVRAEPVQESAASTDRGQAEKVDKKKESVAPQPAETARPPESQAGQKAPTQEAAPTPSKEGVSVSEPKKGATEPKTGTPAEKQSAIPEAQKVTPEAKTDAQDVAAKATTEAVKTVADAVKEVTGAVKELKAEVAELRKKPEPKKETGAIQDVGENLWANRRNFTGKGIQWADVKDLNDALKVKEVTKAKVWTRPNYEQLVADGMQPITAHLIKQVYDAVATSPQVRGTPTDEDLKLYIETVQRVRDGVFAWAADRSAQKSMAEALLKQAGAELGRSTISMTDMMKSATELRERIFPPDANDRFKWSKPLTLIGGRSRKVWNALSPGYDEVKRATLAIREGWPAAQEAWQKQGMEILDKSVAFVREGSRGHGAEVQKVWRVMLGQGFGAPYMQTRYSEAEAQSDLDSLKDFILVNKNGSIIGSFATREAAVEAARGQTKRKTKGGEIRGMNISDAQRIGPERRGKNENISSDRLLQEFGFRGVNFGREGWINQNERQAYLNHAYDALMDLAEIMDVPPKALSLNGALGIAFGAQGRGGAAAAHFVPGVNEINLTKTMGAGTLAHEWGHALDHYFAVQAGLSKQKEPFLSHHTSAGKAAGEIRPEIVAAFKNIYGAMNKRPLTEAEVNLQRQERTAKAKKHLESWINHFRKDVERTATDKEKALAEFDKAAEKLRNGQIGEGYTTSGRMTLRPVIAEMREVINHYTKSSGVNFPDNWKGLTANAEHVAYLLSERAAAKDHIPQEGKTTYAQESGAKDTDKGGKAYWATSWEMFARAFESYVADQLADRAYTNTFLSDAALRAENKNAQGGYSQPYPRDEERKTINQAIDRLVATIETKETDKGVALFSRRTSGYDAKDVTWKTLYSAGRTARDTATGRGAADLPGYPITREEAEALDFIGTFTEHQGPDQTGEEGWYLDRSYGPEHRSATYHPGAPTTQEYTYTPEQRKLIGDIRARGEAAAFSRRTNDAVPSEIHDIIAANGLAEELKAKAAALEKAAGPGSFRITSGQMLDAVLASGSPAAQTGDLRLLKIVQDTFGAPVALINSEGPFSFNGVFHQGLIWLDTNSDVSLPLVFGHELSHRMEKDSPDAYRALLEAVKPLMTNYGRYEERSNLYEFSDEYIQKEMLGDIMGDSFGDPRFWQQVAAGTNESTFQKIVTAIRLLIDRLFERLKGFESHQFVTDLKQARTVLANAVRNYAQERQKGAKSMPKVADQTQTAEFKKWFGDSKVVDENGKPLAVHHGTVAKFNKFDFSKAPDGAHFFTSDEKHAATFGAVRSFYIKIEDPMVITQNDLEAAWDQEHTDGEQDDRLLLPRDFVGQFVTKAKAEGRDGLIIKEMADRDISADMYLPFSPEQIKSATDNRGTFDPRNPDITYSKASRQPAPIFYSQMERTIDQKLPNSGTAEQFKQTIDSWAKQGQIKQEELDWSGLSEWLAEQSGKLTKAQVIEFLRANNIQVTEKLLSDGITPEQQKEIDRRAEELFEAEVDKQMERWYETAAYYSDSGLTVEENEDGKWEVKTDREVLDVFDTEAEAEDKRLEYEQETIDEEAREVRRTIRNELDIAHFEGQVAEEVTEESQVKFPDYTLPGGKDYRELLLTLPEAKTTPLTREDFQITEEGGRYAVYKKGNDNREALVGTAQQAESYIAGVINRDASLQAKRANFRSGHFDQPNIIAHVRFDERTDAEGKRVLFIEEVQSDWHQIGRKDGYSVTEHEYRIRANPSQGGWDVLDRNGQRLDTYQSQAEAQRIVDASKKQTSGVPDAPFKTTWPMLVMKRMIRWAAENGFDRIAWTTGEQQADRYDLSKVVNRIVWYLQDDGQYRITGDTKDRGVAFPDQTVSKDKLSDVVGKDVADKIIRGDGSRKLESDELEYKAVGELSGLDLKVGGEGMKAFYDKMLPSMVNKYVKKWGAKVGRIRIPDINAGTTLGSNEGMRQLSREEAMDAHRAGESVFYGEPADRGTNYRKIREGGTDFIFNILKDDRLTFWIQDEDFGVQPSIDITPEMREAALSGQPLFSRSGRPGIEHAARNWLSDHLRSRRKVSVWNRTVGTMYDLAQKVPQFKPVFDAGQDFLSDVSRIAIEAEDLAPDLFRKMGSIQEVLSTGRAAQKDIERVATQVYRGTVVDERVYGDQELKDRFGLTDEQASLYRQVVEATHKSLDDVGLSTLHRLLRAMKVDKAILHDARMQAHSAEEFLESINRRVLQPLRDSLVDRSQMLRSMVDSTTGDEQTMFQNARDNVDKQLDTLDADIANLKKVTENIQRLKDEGYFPLMRFGKYSVDVTRHDPDTGRSEREAFMTFETEAEANEAARELQEEFPDATVIQGVMSQEEWRLFPGLSPDVIESFARQVGADQTDLFQQYLKIAIGNRSAMKRLIKRKKVPGFAKDINRTLATFVLSNARLASANYHMPDMRNAAAAIPKEMGDVKDQAVNLIQYLTNPTEEFSGLRGYLFFHFIGGSVASALTNLTQVPMVTFPYLARHGAARAGAAIAKWSKPSQKPLDARHAADLKRAEEEGIVSPQEVYNLMATARGGMLGAHKVLGARGVQTALYAWGLGFSMAEQYNRHVTFNAAYEVARKINHPDPYAFAVKAVNETQFVYNRGNRPNWARGILAPVFTFKQFTISYLEMLNRLPARQKAIAIALLILAAGIEGLPFEEDLEDLIDTLMQWAGYNWQTRKEMELWAENTMGSELGRFLLHGVSGLGIPIDIQARLGFGNLIPGTSLLKPSETDKAREVTDVFGAAGSLVRSVGMGIEKLAKGDPAGAIREASPRAVNNFWQGADMLFSGEYRDKQDRLVTKVTDTEALFKMIGFHPRNVSEIQRSQRVVDDMVSLHRVVEDGISDRIARGRIHQDKEMIKDALRDLHAWNERNPTMKIVIKPQQIQARVKQLMLSSEIRTIKQAPKEIRRSVVEEMKR